MYSFIYNIFKYPIIVFFRSGEKFYLEKYPN